MSNEVVLRSLAGIPLIGTGDDLGQILYAALTRNSLEVQDGDILVVAQKIVSKAEGAVVNLSMVTPGPKAIEIAQQTGRDPRLCQVYLDEASEVVEIKGRMVITRHKLGFVNSSSGVDRSNVAPHKDGIVVLLPRDPDASARRIRDSIHESTGAQLAVVISDSFGRPNRDGSVGIAIGVAGISGIEVRHQNDLYGNESNSRIGLVDEVAAAASILMGQADESIPAVLVRGVRYEPNPCGSIKQIL